MDEKCANVIGYVDIVCMELKERNRKRCGSKYLLVDGMPC